MHAGHDSALALDCCRFVVTLSLASEADRRDGHSEPNQLTQGQTAPLATQEASHAQRRTRTHGNGPETFSLDATLPCKQASPNVTSPGSCTAPIYKATTRRANIAPPQSQQATAAAAAVAVADGPSIACAPHAAAALPVEATADQSYATLSPASVQAIIAAAGEHIWRLVLRRAMHALAAVLPLARLVANHGNSVLHAALRAMAHAADCADAAIEIGGARLHHVFLLKHFHGAHAHLVGRPQGQRRPYQLSLYDKHCIF
jgi:hypothetical protein